MEGHTGAVTCLAVGAKWLYSGSADSTIRVGIIMIFLSFYFTPSTDLVQKIAFIAIHWLSFTHKNSNWIIWKLKWWGELFCFFASNLTLSGLMFEGPLFRVISMLIILWFLRNYTHFNFCSFFLLMCMKTICLCFLGVGPWYFTVYLYTEWACWCCDVPYLLESASLVMFIGSNSKSLVCYWWEPFRSDLYTWGVSCKLIFPTILLVCCHSLCFSIYKKKKTKFSGGCVPKFNWTCF